MYKICYNILKYPEANCSRLGRYTDNATLELEKIVQPDAGTMTAVGETVPGTVPVILALAIGSWSDKFGRKPVLMLTLICQTVGFIMASIMLCFPEVNPWFLILTTVPSMLSGGVSTFLSVILAYLNDISTPETKALRMVTFDIIQILSTVLGTLSSSYLLYATSYATVYGICSLLVLFAAVYTYCFIPESLKHKSKEEPTISSIFKYTNLTELFKVAGKKRKYNKRLMIFLIIPAWLILQFIAVGETNVKTLYLRNRFEWTLTKRNDFAAWSSMVGILCTVGSTYLLHNRWKIKETVLITLSILSMIGCSVLYTIGRSNSFIYMSVGVGIFSGLGIPMFRTMLTKLTVPEEMGKIFALVMVVNNICMLISSLTYQAIYNVTLNSHPELFNYVSISLDGIVLTFVLFLMILESQTPIRGEKDETEALLDD